MRRIVLIAAGLLAGCQQEKAAEPAGPDGFAFSAPVSPKGESPLQKVEVPPAALIAIKREDLGDVRIFDGRGKPLSLARFDATVAAAQQGHKVATYPIAGTSAAQGGAAVSIEIARPGQTVSVETNGTTEGTDTAAALLDTRALADLAVAVVLDADLPAQTPVTFTLEASGDLKGWEYVADRVLFSPGAGQVPLAGTRIALPGTDLEQRFLRLSWKTTPGVTIRGAEVVTARSALPARVGIDTHGAKLDDPHSLRFPAPFAASLAAIELAGSAADGVVPVTLYGREADERPWIPLSASTMRPGAKSAVLELGGAQYSQYRIAADERSAGFSSAPAITLRLEPLTLLAAFNGQPPYRLAAGNAKAEGKLFAAKELAEPEVLADALPMATIEAAPPSAVALGTGAAEGPFTPRKLALWAALLIGTAVLAFGAIRLLRANRPGDQSAN